ncbi:zeatin O-glucosyltransferase-like [Silene latifolia]|uniref:zeatin O-glucosyltransferase-like n=1 Tax=Silene latifolia TaxID=37657 RepID=UPI003D772AF7
MRPLRLATVHLYGLLKELAVKYRRVKVIHDSLMASVVQDVKTISNAEVYTFHVTSAFTLFFNRWQSMADKPFQLDVEDIARRVPSNEGYNTTSDFTDFIISQTRLSLELASASINNTCRLIEDRFIDLFKNLPMNSKIRHFPLGPFNPIEKKINVIAEECNNRHRCLQWLDRQEINSVMYVSFGTLTSMTDEQIAEIAIGLDKSGQKFIWVLRFADKGDIFTHDETARQPKLLDKYHQRLKKRGLVVTEWVPQLDILAHPSIGGFMSHCGWGSCVESISMGVAIAAWPITSDQPKNAVLVTEVLGVGIVVREWEHRGTVVVSSTVENAIRKLMQTEEGKQIRKRATELGSRVRASCAKGGSSRLELDSFISHITRS